MILSALIAGCQQQRAVREPAVSNKLPAWAEQTISQSGGLNSWKQTDILNFQAIVFYSRTDSGRFITNHRIEILPWKDILRIETREPAGLVKWSLKKGDFTGRVDISDIGLTAKKYLQGIRQIVLSPVILAQNGDRAVLRIDPVKIEGRLFQPIELAGQNGLEITHFRSVETSRIELVQLKDKATDTAVIIRGYDYYPAENSEVLVPASIEFFESSASGVLDKKFLSINLR